MSTETRIRILCVDDHPLVRDGVAFALNTQPNMELIGTARNGREAIALFQEYRPDITLMDLQLPDMDGIQVMSTIREKHPRARFVFLTTYGGDVQAARALKAGAMGYLLKSMLRKELIDTILTVHRGQKCVAPEIAAAISESMSMDKLSDRELEVLRSVAGGNANKSVAADLGIAEETVKGHMKNIMLKLGANDRLHAVLIGMRRGMLD